MEKKKADGISRKCDFAFKKIKHRKIKTRPHFSYFPMLYSSKKTQRRLRGTPKGCFAAHGDSVAKILQSKTWEHTWAWHRLGGHDPVLLRNVWGKCNHKDRKARLANICVPDIVSVNLSRYRFLKKSIPQKSCWAQSSLYSR